MGACASAKAWAQTLGLLEEMRKNRVDPTGICYGGAIAACEAANAWAWTLELFREMHRLGGSFGGGFEAYKAGLRAYAEVGNWVRALRILQLLYGDAEGGGKGPDVMSMNSVLTACERGSQWEVALGLYENMRLRGPEPSSVTFGAALAACAAGHQWARALQL